MDITCATHFYNISGLSFDLHRNALIQRAKVISLRSLFLSSEGVLCTHDGTSNQGFKLPLVTVNEDELLRIAATEWLAFQLQLKLKDVRNLVIVDQHHERPIGMWLHLVYFTVCCCLMLLHFSLISSPFQLQQNGTSAFIWICNAQSTRTTFWTAPHGSQMLQAKEKVLYQTELLHLSAICSYKYDFS